MKPKLKGFAGAPVPAEELLAELGASEVRVPKRGQKYTLAEVELQMSVVEQLVLATQSRPAITKAMRERFGVGSLRVLRLVARVQERWKQEDQEARPAYRAAAMRRIERYIAQARGERAPDGTWRTKPDYPALARFESLLADIQGTRAPVQVDVSVDVRVSASLQAVIASLTPEQCAERLAAARERRALAERQRASDRALGTGGAQ